MDLQKIKLLFNTILYLKPVQVNYRMYYFVRYYFHISNKYRKIDNLHLSMKRESPLYSSFSYSHINKCFTFLNIIATMNAGFNPKNVWVYDVEFGGEPIIPFGSIVNITKASFAAISSLKQGKWILIG